MNTKFPHLFGAVIIGLIGHLTPTHAANLGSIIAVEIRQPNKLGGSFAVVDLGEDGRVLDRNISGLLQGRLATALWFEQDTPIPFPTIEQTDDVSSRGPSGAIIGARSFDFPDRRAKQAVLWDSTQFSRSPVQIYTSTFASEGLALNHHGDALVQDFAMPLANRLKIVPFATDSFLSADGIPLPDRLGGRTPIDVALPNISLPTGVTIQSLFPAPLLGLNREVAGTIRLSNGRTLPFFSSAQRGGILLTDLEGKEARGGSVLGIGTDGTLVGTLLVNGTLVPAYWEAGTLRARRIFRENFAGEARAANDTLIVGQVKRTRGQRSGFAFDFKRNRQIDLTREVNPRGSSGRFTIQEALDINTRGIILVRGTMANRPQAEGGPFALALIIPAPKTHSLAFKPASVTGGRDSTRLRLNVNKRLGTHLRYSVTATRNPRLTTSSNEMTLRGDDLVSSVSLATKSSNVPTTGLVVSARPKNLLFPASFAASATLDVRRIQPTLTVVRTKADPDIRRFGSSHRGGDEIAVRIRLDGFERANMANLFSRDQVRIETSIPNAVSLQRRGRNAAFNLNPDPPLRDEGNGVVSRGFAAEVTGTWNALGLDNADVEFRLVDHATGFVMARRTVNFRGPRVVRHSSFQRPKFNSTSRFSITLDSLAPAGGTTVFFSVDDHNMFQLPRSATIPAGRKSVTLSVKSGIGILPVPHNVNVRVIHLGRPREDYTARIRVVPF